MLINSASNLLSLSYSRVLSIALPNYCPTNPELTSYEQTAGKSA